MALLAIVTSSAWSQEREQENRVVREPQASDIPAGGVMTPQENDRRITRWLALDNQMVLECAKIGAERATNPEIRSLAESLAAEHKHCLDELNAFRNADRPGQPSERPGSALQDTTPERSRTAVVVQDEGRTRDRQAFFRPTDFLAVREDMCKKLKDIATKEWESVKGAEFDNAFLKHQVMAHEALLASIQAVRPSASSALQPLLDQSVEKYQKHLERARQLCDQLHKPAAAGTVRSDGN
jgi:predicted outer membrane protein